VTALPRVLCRGWRSSTGVAFRCAKPCIQPGEPGGRVEAGWQCALCGALEAKANATRWARECRRTAARAAKGYGGPAEGEDIWRGFKEG